MGKRSREETEEERKERKQAKKDSKKRRKSKGELADQQDDAIVSAEEVPALSNDETPKKQKVSKRSSCQRKTIRMLFSLYPADLDDIRKEIKRSLRHKLLKFVPGIEGVLLAFDNVKVVANGGKTCGVILNEQPQIHYHADLDTLLFTPAECMQLSGKVTECFESHVGLLVHNFFNASITSDHLVASGFSFEASPTGGEWVTEDGSTLIAAEEQVMFTVEKVHECAGTISMEGKDPTVTYSN